MAIKRAPPTVSVPVLSNIDGVRAGQRLKWSAALDQDAAPGRLRYAGNEGDWRCKDQRTRRCRDEDREPADGIA